MGPYSHTEFERDRPAVCEIWKTGCARAHVQRHSTSDMCKALIEWVPIHTQNLSAIRPDVCEVWKTGCARAHVQMHSTSGMCKAVI